MEARASLFRFEEHDVILPMVTLEELDSNKKGMSEVARNARQASRFLDEIVSKAVEDIAAGIPLENAGAREATGRLFLQTESIIGELPARLAARKAENPIIGGGKHPQEGHDKRQGIPVSKDINMRIKARAPGLSAGRAVPHQPAPSDPTPL